LAFNELHHVKPQKTEHFKFTVVEISEYGVNEGWTTVFAGGVRCGYFEVSLEQNYEL
jgi:hypothetical protein